MKAQFLSLKIGKENKEIINSCYLAQKNATSPKTIKRGLLPLTEGKRVSKKENSLFNGK